VDRDEPVQEQMVVDPLLVTYPCESKERVKVDTLADER
jgi:hypothetical protein